MSNQSLFVTAIHTDSGKTLVSYLLTQALQSEYWKPIQSGLEEADRKGMLSLGFEGKIHDEAYALHTPASPHQAAAIDGVEIELDQIKFPESEHSIVVEGAGGILVPLNRKGDTVLSVIKKLKLPTVLVSNYYLGSINHTLTSFEVLKANQVEIIGVVFNGDKNEYSKQAILDYTQLPVLLELPRLSELSKSTLEPYISELKKNYEKLRRSI